ncbi:MAG: translocation/assembly module TamB, partial [Deltaproteobacteria bacterium]|nr:translocation/assembly module TamB [Deltaproteobacteria bacterium]
GHLLITQLEGTAPIVRLIQDPHGAWNLLEALSSETVEEPSATETDGLDMLLESITFTQARLEVTLAGQGATSYHLAETTVAARMERVGRGTTVQVRQLLTQLRGAPLPTVHVGAALTYQDVTTPATVHIANLTLDTPESRLRATGEIHDLQTLEMTADFVIEKLATAEIKQWVPTWPLTQDIAGSVHYRGPLSAVHARIDLAAADAHITGDIRGNVNHEPPSYAGTISLTRFDTRKMLGRQDVGGVIDGTVEVRGHGTTLAALEGQADLTIHALEMSHWQLGNVAVSGSLAQQRGTMKGTLASTLGHATWQGTVDISENLPRYELNLAVEHLDIKKVTAATEPLTSDLNLTGTISGKGFHFADLEARADMSLRPSTVGPVTIDRGQLAARLLEGRVHIAELTLAARETTVAARGEIGTNNTQPGQLTYAFHVGDVSPWLVLAEQRGSGAISVNGTASGNLSALQLHGELQTRQLRVATTTVHDGSLTYHLVDIGQPQPTGTLTAQLRHIDAGVTLEKADATVTLLKSRQSSALAIARVDLAVRDAALRTHHVQGEVSYQTARTTAQVTTLEIETPDGRWRLAHPTQIMQENAGVSVERLLMTKGTEQIQLAGRATLSGPQDFHLHLRRVALASLRTFWSPQPDISGLLTVDAHIAGTAVAPRLTSTLDVTGLRVAGQDYAGFSAALGYDSQRVVLDATFQQDAAHHLTATGTVPVLVRWADGWQADAQGDLTLQVESSGLNLAFLNAFTNQTVSGVAGELALNLSVSGPLSHPQPRGSFSLTQGQGTLTPLGIPIIQVGVQGEVTPHEVRIVALSARSGDGRLTGSGALALRDALPQQLTLSLVADRWPAIRTPRYHITLDGQLDGQGSLSHPRVTGKLRVPAATFRPDLAVLSAQPVQRDPTIIVLPADRDLTGVSSDISSDITSTQDIASELPASPVSENLALDVVVLLPRNTWVKHQDADVELAGEVNVTKPANGKARLIGTINIVRGWLNLRGRRFTLTKGQVVFTGGADLNPTLDIIARHQLAGYVVEAVVGGTVEKPALTLRSEPALEQADILALLLFGKPVNQLAQGEKINFQRQALQLTGGYVAARIAESVSRALGLESLGFDLRQVDLTGGRVGFGRYLGPNTYIAASQDFAGKTGHQVTVDYYLSPEWTLNTSSSAGGDNAAGITWEKRY